MSSCTLFNAHITDQVIQLSNLPRIASGSKEALQIRCNFCGKWEGCGKAAVFYRDEAEVYHVPVVDGLVTVPWEVLVDEGHFWLGFVGQADLTRTTEAIRVEVVKGALTVATATPQDPTPDIYQQILAAYGSTEANVETLCNNLEARFEAAIAVPGSFDEASVFEGTSSDGLVQVAIRSNGYVASARFEVTGMDEKISAEETSYVTDFFIPPAYAPMTGAIAQNYSYFGDLRLEITSPDLVPSANGWSRVAIIGSPDSMPSYFYCDATYGLAIPSLPELTDIRKGLYATYDTAGEAVRAQVDDLDGRLIGLGQNCANLAHEVTEAHQRVTDLGENCANLAADVDGLSEAMESFGETAAGVIASTPTYPYAVGDADGRVVFYIDENGESHFVGQNNKPLKQNGNYDAEINMFICYGQSWSTGYDASAITTTPRYDNIMLDTGIMNNPLDDLTAVATSFVPAVERTGTSSASSGAVVGETPVTAQMHTVKQLMESEDGLTVNDLSYQLLGAAPGMGNMTLAQLAKGTDYYNRLISQVQQAHDIATAMGKRLVVQAFSWVQWGLGSGVSGTYAENLEQLRADIDADVKAITGQTQDVKCITWQAYFYANSLNAKQVYDQFVGAAETYPNIICAGASYHLDRVTASNAHFKSESQDWLGAYFGVAYKRTIIDGEGFEPLKPTKASHSGKILYVKFNVPQRPLVFDTESLSEVTNKGFKLYATDGTEKTITDVAIISPDTVKIVCADDVLSTDRLTYCERTTDVTAAMRAIHGNLRDSQGDYIQYESGAGNNLPLHNWCVIFDKTIVELEG
jgi:hypothetical protein